MLRSTVAVAAALASVASSPLQAQASTASGDLLIASVQDGAAHVRQVITTSAERMSAEDYAYRPTADVRSFAQLVAHIAESTYLFCSIVMGDEQPVSDVERTRTTKAELEQALAESFSYCQAALAAMNGPRASVLVEFAGKPRPALAVMNFRNYHALLHYGNVITYMRLRGKVPPSTEP